MCLGKGRVLKLKHMCGNVIMKLIIYDEYMLKKAVF